MTFPQIDTLSFEETGERLKITIPLQRNWLLYALFTVSIIVWVVMAVIVLAYIIGDVLPGRERYTFVLATMLIVWLVLWYYMGKAVWKQWQYYAANREIIFVDPNMLIVRRPVSILGLTDAYALQHVNPFYFDTKHHCPAFTYGSQKIYFGQTLVEASARSLIAYLNDRYFPDFDDDEW